MKRTQFILAAALFAGIVVMGGGTARAQTPFAVRSVGQRLADGDARMLGRGGWGLTVADSLNPGYKNPASAAWVRHVALTLTGYGESGRHESPNGKRETHRTFVPDVRLALPVSKGRLALTAGFKIERSTEWHTSVDSTWYAWDQEVIGNAQFEREGSAFKVPLGVAWRMLPSLSGAVSVNLEHGSMSETMADYFVEPFSVARQPLYRSVIAVAEDQFKGTSTSVAALFAPLPNLRLGVSWTGAYTIDVTRKTETGGVSERVYNDFQITRPAEISVGFSAPVGGRWEFGADARRQDWTTLVAPEAWMSEPGWQGELVEELELGVGFERRRATERKGGMSNLPLRLGATLHQWPYRVAGQEVIEKSVSAGTGFPLKGNAGHVDLALTYGEIGGLADNGLRSRYLRLAVSVTGLETWW